MKKTMMMAALAAMILASCTSDNDESVKSDGARQEIKFAAPLMYNISRAAGEIAGTKYPNTENFKVYGVKYSDAAAYPGWGAAGTALEFSAEGDEVKARFQDNEKEPTGWFPEFAHYYKKGFNYAFGAYSPASYTTGVTYNNNTGLEVAGFVPEELGQQIDLMYAPRVYDKNMNSEMEHGHNGNEFYDGINIAFRHALTSVHFRVCVDPRYKRAMDAAGYKFVDGDFKIKSIKMTNVKNKGTFNENIKNEVAMTNKNIYQSEPAWTLDGTTADYKFLDKSTYVDIKLPTDAETTVKKAAKDIVSLGGNYALLIPQNLKGSGIQVEIEWQHRKWSDNTTSTLEDMKSVVILEDYMKDHRIWDAGKRYFYNIVFRENLIYFAPSIEDWEDVDNDVFPDPDDNAIVP